MAVARQRRDVLEIVTAVMLGIVSVATALGAYQASVWSTQSTEYQRASDELRQRNLSLALTASITFTDDSAKVFDIIGLDSQIALAPNRADELRAQQEVILAGASPQIYEGWKAWIASGRDPGLFPGSTAEYEASLYVEALSMNYTSFVTNEISDRLESRANLMSAAAIALAVSLFFLGVAGLNASARVTILLMAAGGVALIVGVAIVATALG